jgi:acyl carrier protein
MQQSEVYTRLTVVFRDVFDDESLELRPAMTAKDIAGWDSFNHINLILATETEFGVKFGTAEVESLQNVQSFADLVQAKLQQGQSSAFN